MVKKNINKVNKGMCFNGFFNSFYFSTIFLQQFFGNFVKTALMPITNISRVSERESRNVSKRAKERMRVEVRAR